MWNSSWNSREYAGRGSSSRGHSNNYNNNNNNNNNMNNNNNSTSNNINNNNIFPSTSNNDDWYEPAAAPSLRAAEPLRLTSNQVTPEIAIDCEMVEAIRDRRRTSVLARVSLANRYCQPLLDTYVNPMYPVTDYRTKYSGIRPEHLRGAPNYNEVRDCIIRIVKGRTLIGHDLTHDLAVLGMKNLSDVKMRDTCRCYMSYFKPNERPSLKNLASAVLGETIQTGAHDSMEDAKAAMRLYLEFLNNGGDEYDALPVEKPPKRGAGGQRHNSQAQERQQEEQADNERRTAPRPDMRHHHHNHEQSDGYGQRQGSQHFDHFCAPQRGFNQRISR